MRYFAASSAREKHLSGKASFKTLATSAREMAALFTARVVSDRIAATNLTSGYDQPLARIFRNRFFMRRLKGGTAVSSRTATGSTRVNRHTSSMLRLVD